MLITTITLKNIFICFNFDVINQALRLSTAEFVVAGVHKRAEEEVVVMATTDAEAPAHGAPALCHGPPARLVRYML